MVAPLGLESLLAALREAGLRVGVGEVERLRRVLDLGPDFSGDSTGRVRSLLRAVVVKRAEEREVFEKVCDAWLESAALPRRPDLARPAGTPGAPRPPRRRWRALAGVVALLTAVAAIIYLISIREPEPPPVPPPPPPPAVKPPEVEPEVVTPADVRQRQFESWVPTLTVIPAEPEWKGWPALSLCLLALLTAGGLPPDELAAFLGTDTAARPVSAVAVDPAWVAACALAPSSVDEQTAFALQQRLGISSSPWALRELRQDAGRSPGRLAWTPAERARCVNWLTGVEEGGEGRRLDEALDFWEEVYDGERSR